MWSVEPSDISVSTIAKDAAAKVRDKSLAKRLRGARPSLEANHAKYADEASSASSHEIAAEGYVVADVTDAEILWIYKQHMAKPTGGAREWYDALVAAARYELCSYCQHGQATTLDHYVPKALVGGLAIEPLNLVPACPQCNHKLLAYSPSARAEQLFHPFYESVDARWLYARVLEGEPVAIEFFVDPAPELDHETRVRVENQFNTLGLDLMYAAVSGRDLAEAKEALAGRAVSPEEPPDARIVAVHSAAVASALLSETASIAFAVDPNSRRGAVYEALASNVWFCSDGFASRL